MEISPSLLQHVAMTSFRSEIAEIEWRISELTELAPQQNMLSVHIADLITKIQNSMENAQTLFWDNDVERALDCLFKAKLCVAEVLGD